MFLQNNSLSLITIKSGQWLPFCQKQFEIWTKISGYHLARFSNGWAIAKVDHWKSFSTFFQFLNDWISDNYLDPHFISNLFSGRYSRSNFCHRSRCVPRSRQLRQRGSVHVHDWKHTRMGRKNFRRSGLQSLLSSHKTLTK